MFYPLCYEGTVDLDSIESLEERYALEVQISEFGQVPRQIFTSPHPRKILGGVEDEENDDKNISGKKKEEEPVQVTNSFTKFRIRRGIYLNQRSGFGHSYSIRAFKGKESVCKRLLKEELSPSGSA